MAEIRTRFQKWKNLITFVLVICIFGSANANRQTDEINLNFFDFEHIKNEFFTQTDFNKSNFDRGIDTENAIKHLQCLRHLAEIQLGLLKFEPWAMKSNLFH